MITSPAGIANECDVVQVNPEVRRTPKKPSLFMKWFMKKSEEAWNLTREEKEEMNAKYAKTPHPATNMAEANILENSGGTTFTLFPCDGGTLITTKYIDQQNFEVRTKRYIVADGGDLGKRIEEIFSFETLKR